jgi:hypothetical protein
MRRLLAIAIIFGAGVAFAPRSALLAQGKAKKAQKNIAAKVEGVFVIPKTVPSFENHRVDIGLYEFDPKVEDGGSTLIDHVSFRKVSHTEGKETRMKFSLDGDIDVVTEFSYNVTFNIRNREGNTHWGKFEHDEAGLVLTDGKPSRVTILVREHLPDGTIESPDGMVRVITLDDGSLEGHFVESKDKKWNFPAEGSKIAEATNYGASFAPADAALPKTFGRALFVVHGTSLYCLNGDDGKTIWTTRIGKAVGKDAEVVMEFEEGNVLITIDEKVRTFEMKTGKEVKK